MTRWWDTACMPLSDGCNLGFYCRCCGNNKNSSDGWRHHTPNCEKKNKCAKGKSKTIYRFYELLFLISSADFAYSCWFFNRNFTIRSRLLNLMKITWKLPFSTVSDEEASVLSTTPDFGSYDNRRRHGLKKNKKQKKNINNKKNTDPQFSQKWLYNRGRSSTLPWKGLFKEWGWNVCQ